MKNSRLSIFTIFFAITMTLSFFNSVWAGEEVRVSVKGMVCSYCSSGVERSFGRQKEVETVKVDLDKRLVELVFKDNLTLSDEKITEVITKAGLNVESIERANK